jgi:hypothetical protein
MKNLDIIVSTETVIFTFTFVGGRGSVNMRKKKSEHLQGLEHE